MSPEPPSSINKDSLQKVAGLVISKTFDTLKSTLAKTIADSGLVKAIETCQLNASVIERTYAGDGITLKRVSAKFRNEKNAPDATEMEWLNSFADNNSDLQQAKTYIDHSRKEFHFYKPIIIAPLCLSCHGTPDQDITAEVLKKLQLLYPKDLATGYKKDELRGMWHLTIRY